MDWQKDSRLLAQALQTNGFHRIIVADDLAQNLAAARELASYLPGIMFEFYERGDTLLTMIPGRKKEIDLILTDREMETPDAGLDVLAMATDHMIPTIVCSGGFQHRNQPLVRCAPLGFGFPEGLTKDKPELWFQILMYLTEKIMPASNFISALIFSRRAGTEFAPSGMGADVRRLSMALLKS